MERLIAKVRVICICWECPPKPVAEAEPPFHATHRIAHGRMDVMVAKD